MFGNTKNDEYIKPDDLASLYIPFWTHDDLKSRITIRHLATHSSGMENSSVTEVERRKMIELGLHTHRDLPGWKGQFWKLESDPFIMARDSTPILYPPRTRFEYSNPGAAKLAYAEKGHWQGIQLIDSSLVEQVIIFRGDLTIRFSPF